MLISPTSPSIVAAPENQTTKVSTISASTTSSQSPTVIVSVQQNRSGLSSILTGSFIQDAVNGENALIQGYNNMDWSIFKGLTSDQLKAAQLHNAQQIQKGEQGIVAMAEYSGAAGLDLSFTKVNSPALAGEEDSLGIDDSAVTTPAAVSNPAPSPATTSSTGAANGPSTPAASSANKTVTVEHDVSTPSSPFAYPPTSTAAAALALLTASKQQSRSAEERSSGSTTHTDHYI